MRVAVDEVAEIRSATCLTIGDEPAIVVRVLGLYVSSARADRSLARLGSTGDPDPRAVQLGPIAEASA